jgi:tetratricopeptide (TPR) repeat protein
VLVGVTAQEEAAVLDCLDAAFAARLLEERRAGRGERHAFAHALIGQALYAEVPRYRLRRLHLRAGETLERLRAAHPEAWAELARHFLAAGEEERATRYAILAGDHAASLYANAEAVQHYRAALELLATTGAAAEVARLREKLGNVLRRLGQYDAALEVLEQAAETWEEDEDLESLARVLFTISHVHSPRGTAQQGLARLQPWAERIEAGASPGAQVALYEGLAQLLFACGRFEEYLTATEQAEAHLRTLGDARALARVTYEHGNALQLLGRLGEALERLEEAIRLAEVVGDDEHLSLALGEKALVHHLRGEFEMGERLFRRAIDLAERVGNPHLTDLNVFMRNWLFISMGKWDEVRRSLERTLVSTDGHWGGSTRLLIRGNLQRHMGDWEQAARSLDEAISLFEPYGDLQGQRGASRVRAVLDVLEGNPDAARARLVPLLDRPGLEECDVTSFLPVLAWAYLELDDLPHAEQTIEQALRRARAEELRLFLVVALWVQALILTRRQEWDAAASALEEGLALARAMPYPYAEALLLHTYGRLHIQRGEGAEARERLEAALASFRRLGARKDVEQVEQLLSTLG